VHILAFGLDDTVLGNANVTLNDTTVSTLIRGIQTVELANLQTCSAANPQQYDTCGDATAAGVLAAYIGGLKVGSILVGGSADDAQASLGWNAMQALATIGVDVSTLVFRGKFAFVAQIGRPEATLMVLKAPGGNNFVLDVIVQGVLILLLLLLLSLLLLPAYKCDKNNSY